MTTTVNRSDISLEEEAHPVNAFQALRIWTASLSGFLTRDGKEAEFISSFARSGDTLDGAIANLEMAIAKNGWSIK